MEKIGRPIKTSVAHICQYYSNKYPKGVDSIILRCYDDTYDIVTVENELEVIKDVPKLKQDKGHYAIIR
jgi:hypothetical protein